MDAQPQATIVADSLAPSGVRLTTMLLTYWTMVHQDILTHRTMYKMTVDEVDRWLELTANKSTNSNRAKPTRQVLQEVWSHPFVPTRFPKRSVTMHSSKGYLDGWRHQVCRFVWLKARYIALFVALVLMYVGCHKQIANRLLMPWTMTTLVITAVDTWWVHFFNLRDHFMAQDEVQQVANLAHKSWWGSAPENLRGGEWHLPFISELERDTYNLDQCIAASVARCARTSYARTHEEMIQRATDGSLPDDIQFYATRLHGMVPPHDGPKEHQAVAHVNRTRVSGTLFGWVQLRHCEPMTERLKAVCQPPHPVHA